MSRYRAIYDSKGLLATFERGECTWLRDDYDQGEKRSETVSCPVVIRDIEPYRNMIDGKMITSRREHRELLKRHNCVEIGNEVSAAMKPPEKPKDTSRKQQLHKLLADDSDRDIKKLIKRTVKEMRP